MTIQSRMQAKNASPRILGAARAIAHREGAGKITIDAVAREADLSKGGVLYNFPTKRALLAGLLDEMLGHLEAIVQARAVDDALSMAILAAAASDPRLLDPLRAELTGDLERILSDTQDTSGAMVVVLAIQGLRFQKLLGLPDGGAGLRGRVIEQLRAMINELE